MKIQAVLTYRWLFDDLGVEPNSYVAHIHSWFKCIQKMDLNEVPH